MVSNSSGKIAVSAITSTELGYLDGVTGNIQTQIDNLSTVTTATISTSGYGSIPNTISITRIGNVVTITGSITFSNTNTNLTIGTIPSGFRPKNYIYGVCIQTYTTSTPWKIVGGFNINTSGVMRCSIDTTGEKYITTTYLAA